MTALNLVNYVRDIYRSNEFIPLHAPTLGNIEKNYVVDAIDSTYVSSVGSYVDLFEKKICEYTASPSAVAMVNGTAALFTALYVAGVRTNDLVITQTLSFVATANVIAQLGASPVFLDVDNDCLGLCPVQLKRFLDEHCEINDEGQCVYLPTQQIIKAVVPMHTFGHPVKLDELYSLCKSYHLYLVEDAAESLGTLYKNRHAGTVGDYAAISFNGNKIITTGSGGMLLSKCKNNGMRAKHISTTAKVPHSYEYFHDEMGFNNRLSNLNAALGCGQMERIQPLLNNKRKLAENYRQFFLNSNYKFIVEPSYAHSNYWLNAVICEDKKARDDLLEVSNASGVMTRPIWTLLSELPMYRSCLCFGELNNAKFFAERVVNIPSSPIEGL